MGIHQNISPLSQTHRIETVYGGGRLMEEGRIEEVSTSRADEIGFKNIQVKSQKCIVLSKYGENKYFFLLHKTKQMRLVLENLRQ